MLSAPAETRQHRRCSTADPRCRRRAAARPEQLGERKRALVRASACRPSARSKTSSTSCGARRGRVAASSCSAPRCSVVGERARRSSAPAPAASSRQMSRVVTTCSRFGRPSASSADRRRPARHARDAARAPRARSPARRRRAAGFFCQTPVTALTASTNCSAVSRLHRGPAEHVRLAAAPRTSIGRRADTPAT